MFYLFHGEGPFSWMPPVEAARAAAMSHTRPSLRPNLDARLARLIEGCWSPDPAARPAAREVCDVLESILPEVPAAAPVDTAGDSAAAGCGGCSIA